MQIWWTEYKIYFKINKAYLEISKILWKQEGLPVSQEAAAVRYSEPN
jgi:hypothetical protein